MPRSPLAQPGTGDGGGLNVYVHELSSALARAGAACDVYTRAFSQDLPAIVDVEPGFRVHHVAAGPLGRVAKEDLEGLIPEFADAVLTRMRQGFAPDAIHANYWLSALGVEADTPVVLFVGRIQPLKGADVAVEAFARMVGERPGALLIIVGGPSGPDGMSHLAHLHDLVARRGLRGRVRFVDPQPHEMLSSYYRAASVVLVPSRSESFGLVALQAAACGPPVLPSPAGGPPPLGSHAQPRVPRETREPA